MHSLKDLPTDDPEGLVIGAVPQRADPRDALIGPALDALPQRARVGTGSARRRAQLLHLRPDLDVRDIRGNVPTRLHKLDAGDYDAIVLAMAGLARLSIPRRDLRPLDAMISAPGQGALGVQCRRDDDQLRLQLRRIEHAETRRRVDAERVFLAAFGGGCHVAAAAHADVTSDGRLRLVAGALTAAGWQRWEQAGDDAETLGRDAAVALRAPLGGR